MAKAGRHSRYPPRKSSTSTLVFTLLIVLSFVVLILLGLGIVSLPSSSSSSSKSDAAHDLSSIVRTSVHRGAVGGDRSDQWVELISWEPRAFVYHNFLSKEESEYLIELAKPHMQKSSVVDTATGKGVDSRHGFPDHGEGLQVLHYEEGQKYEPHYDYFLDDFNTHNGGQRIATVLMYLTDVEEGGETVFPNAVGNHSAVPYWDKLSECGKGGISVRPKTGDALLFWSMKPDGSLDPLSLHAGCPVIKGNKWSSTKWMRVNELDFVNNDKELVDGKHKMLPSTMAYKSAEKVTPDVHSFHLYTLFIRLSAHLSIHLRRLSFPAVHSLAATRFFFVQCSRIGSQQLKMNMCMSALRIPTCACGIGGPFISSPPQLNTQPRRRSLSPYTHQIPNKPNLLAAPKKRLLCRPPMGKHVREDYLVKNLSAVELQELIKGDRNVPLVIDFYATWCGPCILMAQQLEMLAVEYESSALIVKVNTDDEFEFARDMQVRGLPTLYFVSPDSNKDAIRTEGLIPIQMMRDIIDSEM
ncbi:hypothetical protein V2J09_009895 [Rumex salicifolius]